MSRRAVAVLAAVVLPLVAACGQVQPVASPAPQTPLAAPAETATPAPETATPLPVVESPTPAPVTPAPETPTPAKPTPSATPAAPKPAPPAPPADNACATSVVKLGSKGACTKQALTLLKQAGYYSPTPGTSFGVSAVNWTLQYQRSRGLDDNGRVDAATWGALLGNMPQLPVSIPASCKTGTVICVSKAQGKLFWLQNGAVKKTTAVRFGGWNQDAKTKEWRMFATVNGTYRVYNKHPNPSSENYGDGAMPYSTMFHPGMYVHYSAGFASVGYSGSSHGCVNVKSRADAKWIMDNTPIGTKVVVYEG